ncbi:hypothetical protein LCGC14_2430900 [marine sediment metagenome]|uniref:Uncharacterized protein n=1 Tax=marine sediment metagenome TaxID=412755 RepID=A0A0F9C9B0_9ZZZZ
MNLLEKKWGRRVTYDETIKFLLQEEIEEIDKNKFLINIKKYQGTLKSSETRKLLRELREEDYEREKRYTKHINRS